MLDRYSQLVIRFRWPIVLIWVIAGVVLPLLSPAWNSVTHDGDFAYLPDDAPTVTGLKLLDTAFETKPPKSQIVVGIVRADAQLEKEDFAAGYDAARRLINLFAARVWSDLDKGIVSAETADTLESGVDTSSPARAIALLNQAVDISVEFEAILAALSGNAADRKGFTQPLAETFYLRAAFLEKYGKQEDDKENAAEDLKQALALDSELQSIGIEGVVKRLAIENFPITDMWTWRSPIVGGRLVDTGKHSRLIVMHFPTEFMAVGNVAALERVEKELDKARQVVSVLPSKPPGQSSELIVSGSAAVGADLLRSSARSIRNADWLTAALVLFLLVVVYRSPLMVAIPMAVIYLSLQISTSLMALLAQAAAEPNWPYWDLKLFTTTRIFIVVLLFGAGTDFCLFLISRFREECARGSDSLLAVRKSIVGVGSALVGSAVTTILGLAMLFFAEFGKYHYTGPVISFCLLVAALASISLAPALLAVLGPLVFWPWQPLQERRIELAIKARRRRARVFGWPISEWVVRRPAWVIGVCLLVLAAPALQGIVAVDHVTYDVLMALGRGLPSRHGADTLQSLYEPGEAGPIVLLISKPGFDPDKPESRGAIFHLHEALFTPQIASVRSILDPLGEQPRDKLTSLTSTQDLAVRLMRANQVTRDVFIGRRLGATVLKFEAVPRMSPFSREGRETLENIEKVAERFLDDPSTPLHGAKLDVGGTTAALRDLEHYTKRDYRTMRWLVSLCVLGTLILALRRIFVSIYIVATVLLGFFVTMGLTYWTFAIANLDAGYLLDWRMPLFLFVILVAVGADYSVYLAARVFEEQAQYGPFTGLRRAIEQTGGVISSCGLIMAAAFISMTSGVWASAFPESWVWPRDLFGSSADIQRGIVELGYALALGILLDTFVVRTILLPAFLASLAHWKAYSDLKLQKAQGV